MARIGKERLVREAMRAAPTLSQERAGYVVDAIFAAIAKAVADGDVAAVKGFGSFQKMTRAASRGRNPQTGAAIDIPEKHGVRFRIGDPFSSALNPAPRTVAPRRRSHA